MNLLERASYGEQRHSQILANTPEVKLVLFSLQQGQEVKGRGEPRVQLLALEGQGELWAGGTRRTAQAGTLLPVEPGVAHGAQAGDGRFLVLGIITPRP